MSQPWNMPPNRSPLHLLSGMVLGSAFGVLLASMLSVLIGGGVSLLVAFGFLAGAGLGLVISKDMAGLKQSPPEGMCPNCGYDVTGLRSGRCPECGRALTRDTEHGASRVGDDSGQESSAPR